MEPVVVEARAVVLPILPQKPPGGSKTLLVSAVY
jgi:hypothetical protein